MNTLTRDAIIAMAVLFGLALIYMFILVPYFITFKIEDEKIKTKLFGLIRIYSVSLRNIENVELVPYFDAAVRTLFGLLAQPSGITRVWSKKVILITKKRYIFKYYILTPHSPEEYLQELKEGLTQVNRASGM